jgi:ribosomal protein S18 acetylase RimI-like enzyme
MLTLRKAIAEDCESVWRVFTRAVRGLARSHYTPEQVEAWAALRGPEDFVGPIEQQIFFVAEEHSEVVGYGQLDATTGVVGAVYVVPEIAGRGAGRLLLAALEVKAREAGLEALRLRASLNAVGFYRHMGYAVEREEAHRLPSGVEFAVVQMVKSLAS